MKKKAPTKGRRIEMKIPIGVPTLELWRALHADNDYSIIGSRLNPEVTRGAIRKYMKESDENPELMIPKSVANEIKKYYQEKAEALKAQNAA